MRKPPSLFEMVMDGLEGLLWVLLVLGAVFGAVQVRAATPAPMQWFEGWTFYGGAGNEFTIWWLDNNEPPASRYEVRAYWLERPSKSPILYKLKVTDVTRTKDAAPALSYTVSKRFKMPGAGTFSYEIRSCFAATPAEVCTTWSSSLDPSVTFVKGTPRAWRAYLYTEAPAVVIPIPASTPTGPEK